MVKSLKASSISYSFGTIKIRALYSTSYMNIIYKVDGIIWNDSCKSYKVLIPYSF